MKPLIPQAQRVINGLQAFGLSLDCPEMVVTHASQTYRGPGRIIQNPEGVFEVQHFPVISPDMDIFSGVIDSPHLSSHLLPGQLIESSYFKVEAISIEGEVWVAERVWFEASVDTHNRGVILYGTTGEIAQHQYPTNSAYYIRTIGFHDGLRFPANGTTQTTTSTLLNKTNFTIDNISCSLTINEKTVEFVTSSQNQFPEAFHLHCIDAIQFVSGHQIKPFYKLVTDPVRNVTEAYAIDRSALLWILQPPIKCETPNLYWDCINLVESIVQLCRDGKPRFLSYHHDIATASLSGLEPTALAACVVVDGMAEQYFKAFSAPDPVFVEQCLLAMPELERLAALPDSLITPRVLSKLLGSLRGANSSSSINTLYKLFDKTTAGVWNTLRHPAAHGSLIDKDFTAQELYSNMMTCLYMYYAMSLSVANHDRLHVNYSVSGYPLVENVVIAAQLELTKSLAS